MNEMAQVAAQQAATGVTAAGATWGPKCNCGSKDGMDDIFNERKRPQAVPVPKFPDESHNLLLLMLLLRMKTGANTGTNFYKDNQDEKQDCKLFAYKDRKTMCPGSDTNAHHVIPDHCWRSVNLPTKIVQNNVPQPAADVIVENTGMEEAEGRTSRYYYDKMDRNEGFCICVKGSGKNAVHGAIHKDFDRRERQLGENGDPKWTAKLGELEDAAAKSVAQNTGCSEAYIRNQLENHHRAKGLSEDNLLRADPVGSYTSKEDPIWEYRTKTMGGTRI